METVNKGCKVCKVGFIVAVGQEYVWNHCPMCSAYLELGVEGLEIEYETAKEE
jgi:hypothetical protein